MGTNWNWAYPKFTKCTEPEQKFPIQSQFCTPNNHLCGCGPAINPYEFYVLTTTSFSLSSKFDKNVQVDYKVSFKNRTMNLLLFSSYHTKGMMKIRCFYSAQFLIFSPIRFESGNAIFSSRSPLLSFSILRYFGTKFVADCNSHEKLNLGLGNIKGLDDALCLYENMSKMKPLPSVIQFTKLLASLVNLKEYSAAIRLFKDFFNLGVSVNEYTMNIAINCYCLSNRVDYGFSILGWFFKRGMDPNVFTFSTLLKGLFRENKINEAQELFRKMVREELCELSVVTYGTVIDGLCKAGNTSMAIEFLRVMEKGRTCKPNSYVYNMVIDSLCKDKMIDSALKLFDEMSEKGINRNIVTYNALISGLCNLSRWSEVKTLMKEMLDCKIYPNVRTYSSLVDALCKEGLVDEAEDVIDVMKQQNVNPNIVSFNSLMDGYCLQGHMDKARNVFDSMASMDISPDIWSFNILINGYCKKYKKKMDDAMHLFRQMTHRGVKPNLITYNTILKGLFHGGKCSLALEIFDEMRVVGLKPNFYTYCNVLEGLCRNGRAEQALMLLDDLEIKEGEIHLHTVHCNIVMDGFCKAKKPDAARAIFEGLASKGLKPDVVTYTALIHGFCQNGLLEDAQNLFLRMEEADLSPNEITYNLIVQGNLKEGKYDDAAKLFDKMDAKGFSPDLCTFELLLDLLGTTEQNPTIFKMIQKLAPNALKQKLPG